MTDTTLTIPEQTTSGDAASDRFTVLVDRIDRAAWLDLIQQFDDATIYQTWDYETVRWGEQRLSHLVLHSAGEVAAAAQVRVVTMPLLKCGIAYVFSGPLWRRRGAAPDLTVLRHIIDALHIEYVRKRKLALRIVPNEIRSDDDRIEAKFLAGGFARLDRVRPYRSFLIDLSLPEDRLLSSLHIRCRSRVRSAIKNNIELESGTSDSLFEEFLHVYRLMRQRKQFEERVDARDFQKIQSQLPDNLKMLVIVCRLEGVAAAAGVCGTIGDTGNLLLMATSRAALKSSASAAVVWRAMVEMKNAGVRYFDMGGVSPDENPGGYMFKNCFGGREIHHLGAYEACNSLLSRVTTHGGEHLRETARRTVGFARRLVPKRNAADPAKTDEPVAEEEDAK